MVVTVWRKPRIASRRKIFPTFYFPFSIRKEMSYALDAPASHGHKPRPKRSARSDAISRFNVHLPLLTAFLPSSTVIGRPLRVL